MASKAQSICEEIARISPHIRFVGIIGPSGETLAYTRRKSLKPLLDAKNTHYQFSHLAMQNDLNSFFNKSLGKTEFVWEERKKVQTIAFKIRSNNVWVSIDKKVVRSAVLRIIDSCLPVVRRYS